MSMSNAEREELHNMLLEYSKARQFTNKREIYESIIKFVDSLMDDAHEDGYGDGYENGKMEGEEIAMDSGGF